MRRRGWVVAILSVVLAAAGYVALFSGLRQSVNSLFDTTRDVSPADVVGWVALAAGVLMLIAGTALGILALVWGPAIARALGVIGIVISFLPAVVGVLAVLGIPHWFPVAFW